MLETFYKHFDPLWVRFQEALNAREVSWAQELLDRCRERNDLASIWLASDFVANSCIHTPELLFDLIQRGELDRPRQPDETSQYVIEQLRGTENEARLHSALRKIRRREMVRLAWRDLSGQAEVEETMNDLSVLADVCIDQALRFHEVWLSERFGPPMSDSHPDHGPHQAKMVVVGMGKLGGVELNYSSDIDLIFAYDEAGETRAGAVNQKSISNQEFFIKLGRKIIDALDPVTQDGFVFRTDMRLRPNGESGPLVLSFSAMEHYYQTHGRGWERYAFVKARVVAGDKTAGKELIEILRPFVYRKYLDFTAFDSIREMKSMIRRELTKKGIDDDIKLGWGGIREVEFLVQSHQLIRGGRENRLQTTSIYQAMFVLVEPGVIDKTVKDALVEGYRFLRNSEHRLQMVADRQTQQLPTADRDRFRLAWSMGFDCWENYLTQLDFHRAVIHDQFKLILESPGGNETTDSETRQGKAGKDEEEKGSIDRGLANAWQGILDKDLASAGLASAGFSQPESTYSLLKEFRQGRLYQMFSSNERDRIDRLIPLALRQALTHHETERATAAFISVVEAIGRRSVYLSLLIENPIALKQLLHLCAASPWIARYIGQHPVVMDELLSPIDESLFTGQGDIRGALKYRMSQVDEQDDEARINAMREFHHGHVLRVAAADILGTLDADDIHYELSQLAEALLEESFHQAVLAIQKKQQVDNVVAGVIAYGKFASGELGYYSDLDIVVCFEKTLSEKGAKLGVQPAGHSGEAEYFYSRVSRRLIHLLTTRTLAGTLYELDMRLRPSGRRGTLVTSLTGFVEYQLNSAWTWEHQALVRAKAVVGDEAFITGFEEARARILRLKRDETQLKADVMSMRQKMIDVNCQSTDTKYDMKLGQGGIVDIEFLLQYWILKNAHDVPSLTHPGTTTDTIRALVKYEIIPDEIGATLIRVYRTYLRQSLDLKLMDLPVLVPWDVLKEERAAIKSIWASTFS